MNYPLQDAPQPCTKDTKGLLFFDLKTARMYRCNGIQWDKWEPNIHSSNRMFNTAPESLGLVASTKNEPDPELEREKFQQREWEREKSWARDNKERGREWDAENEECPPGRETQRKISIIVRGIYHQVALTV